jgi:uncharacterized protein YjbI with pentapeptide repeats
MRLIDRVQRKFSRRWYRGLSTDKLIVLVRQQNSVPKAKALLETLRERLAHQDGSLDHVDWSSAALAGALLSSGRMRHARFARATLCGAYFGYSDLSRADFQRADLGDAHFREARLSHSHFDGARLEGANFARADLAGSSFAGADLTSANFWGANLRGAILTGATLVNCNLADVTFDESTTLPDGRRCADHVCWDRFTKAQSSKRD